MQTANKVSRRKSILIAKLKANTPAQALSQLHSLEQAAGSISLYMNAIKTEFMYFKRVGAIPKLSGSVVYKEEEQ